MKAIAVGLILKRSPVILRRPRELEAGMQSFHMAINRIEGSPYNKDFFESQVAKKKSADPVPFESRNGSDDIRSSSRQMDRSLYLTVLPVTGKQWQFPSTAIEGDESLHDAAKRQLSQLCGPAADIWVTGRLPVAVSAANDAVASGKARPENKKIFFMKSQLLSGHVDRLLADKTIKDFAWLTKDELAEKMDKRYFEDVKDTLADL